MSSEFFFSIPVHVVTSRMLVIKYRLEPRALYISPLTVIANFYQRTFIVFAGASVRPKEKAETCVRASMYYIEACLLQSLYFVTLAVV